MQPRKTNIAARAAQWSAAHRKVAIFGWLAFVIVSIAVGGAVGQKQLTDAEAVSGESGKAEVALERGKLNPSEEVVLVQSDHSTATAPAFKAAVDEATQIVRLAVAGVRCEQADAVVAPIVVAAPFRDRHDLERRHAELREECELLACRGPRAAADHRPAAPLSLGRRPRRQRAERNRGSGLGL